MHMYHIPCSGARKGFWDQNHVLLYTIASVHTQAISERQNSRVRNVPGIALSPILASPFGNSEFHNFIRNLSCIDGIRKYSFGR